MNHFLDSAGLTYLWGKIKSVFATKAELDDVAFVGDDDNTGGSIDFNPQADTVWNKAQTLSSSQKAQARTNIGAQETLVSGTNIKTINNQSLLGSGNISISGGGGGGGDVNVIEVVKVNGTALTPDANKAVDVPVPTETTVTNWGFTKNAGTITGINMNGASKGTSGVVDLGTVITAHQDISGKADKATTLAGYGITDAHTKTEDYSKFYALSGVKITSGSSIDVTTLDAGTYYISSVDKLTDPPTESQNGLSTYFWVLKPNNRHTIIRLQISDSPNIWEKYYMASSGWSDWVLVQDDLSKKPNVYSGSTAPSSSTGSNGDIYIQTS